MFDVNLRGVAHGVQAAYPIMVEQGFGHIVNTASMAGLIAGGHAGSYFTTKHAVVGLSKALRIEARQYGVKVSVVCPGVIRTPIPGRTIHLALPCNCSAAVPTFLPALPISLSKATRSTQASYVTTFALLNFVRITGCAPGCI